ncbi:MAG: hypothetical protein Ct9H300mP27_05790 [Chloroflexota bacterium]|nr:MAG: hypothetical protein Ct9H300mP27_05790 [Chloroflexota bacterium]
MCPRPQYFPVLISALAPAMLRVAGELADGTITWMAGISAIEEHIVPRINKQRVMRVEMRPGFVLGSPYVLPMTVMRLLKRPRHGFKGTGPWSITVGY